MKKPKTPPRLRLINFLLITLVFTGGCDSISRREYKVAKNEANAGHNHVALSIFDKLVLRNQGEEIALLAAREAARISFYEIKDFRRSLTFLRYLVMYSPDSKERHSAQVQIAEIYFTHMNNYPKAVIEINKLLSMENTFQERAKYKINLARAYFYQNNFLQAKNESEEFLHQVRDEKIRFDLSMLIGNIYLAQKDLRKAIEVFKDVLKNFPEISKKENVALTIAICHEELKEFNNAIEMLEVLKKTHPMPEYIDIRIQRLRERLKNAPGAKGNKK